MSLRGAVVSCEDCEVESTLIALVLPVPRAANDKTGLMPDYTDLDGTPEPTNTCPCTASGSAS